MKKRIIIFLIMGLCIYNIVFIFLFDKIYPESVEINFIGEVVSLPEYSDNYNKYIVKTIKNNGIKKSKNTKLIIYVNEKQEFFPGDIVKISGEFEKPDEARNYKGFNYRNYLKQSKIYGIVKVSNIIYINKKIDIYSVMGIVKQNLLKKIDLLYKNAEYNAFLKGILLGDDSNLGESTKTNFRNSSLSHILAISGMHVSYIIIGVKFILEKIFISKKKQNCILVFFLILFCIITGFHASCIRACIMASMILVSSNLYKKNNFYISLLLSFIILIFINPFNILNVGMWLSYMGTLGIVLFSKLIYRVLEIKIRNKNIIKSDNSNVERKTNNYLLKMIGITCTSISAQFLIFPIIIFVFNSFSFTFFISNFFASFLVGPVLIIGYISIILSYVIYPISKVIAIFECAFIHILLCISKICSNLPLSNIKIPTPNLLIIILYYYIVFYNVYLFNNYKFKYLKIILKFPKIEYKKILKYLKNKKIKVISILLVVIILNVQSYYEKTGYLRINFVDVGQGDCTFIQTPFGKNVIIDGGNREEGGYDYGKNVVIPYILDKGYKKIDYMIVSHFDNDHVGGLLSVIDELNVNKIIISRQIEKSENFEKFKKLVKEKQLKVITVEKGDIIKIENNLYFNVLWPNEKNEIYENALNNNSIVCKLCYKNFSMLFTGDIEELAEREILKEYDSNNTEIEEYRSTLCSNILKVAHHGSKTSSIQEFIEAVNPKIALIGVGKNNKFGHPNDDVLNRLNDIRK